MNSVDRTQGGSTVNIRTARDFAPAGMSLNVNKRDFVGKFKFRNYATITLRASRQLVRF